jgi:hypothetical protein
MPMYDPSGLVVDAYLTDFSTGFEPPNLVGFEILPQVPAANPFGSFRTFDRSNRVIFPDRREPGTVANEVRGGKWSADTYKTVQRSLQAAVADEEVAYAGAIGGVNNSSSSNTTGNLDINPEEDAAALVKSSLALKAELLISTLVRNTANYPGGSTVTLNAADQWDLYAGATSDPILVVRAAILKINSLIGVPPNTMLMPRLGVPWLENHPDVVARFSSFSLTNPDAFRLLTGFEGKIVLADVKYNNANSIDATESLVDMWGKDVWIGYVAPGLNRRDLSFGKTFMWPPAGSGELQPTERWREESRKSDLVRTTWQYDPKITTSMAGYLIKTAFSAAAF